MTPTHLGSEGLRAMGSRVAWLLLNANYGRVTGNELGLDFMARDFLEAFGPPALDALEAVGNRKAMARMLIELYGSQGEPETLARLLDASYEEGSEAMRAAFLRTVRESGSNAIEPFREALPDDHHAACYLFKSIRELGDLGCETAIRSEDDPWSCLGALVDGLLASQGWVLSKKSTVERFWRHVEAEVASEGPEPLWKGYLWDLGRHGVRMEDGLSVASAYRQAVKAVTDPHWITDRLLEVCSGMANGCHGSGHPERDEAVSACLNTIRSVRGPQAVEPILVNGFKLAIGYDTDEAMDSLLDATREAVADADDPVEAVGVLVAGLPVVEPEWPPIWWVW